MLVATHNGVQIRTVAEFDQFSADYACPHERHPESVEPGRSVVVGCQDGGMAKCADPGCRVPLSSANRSNDTLSMCSEHGDLVWAFRPSSVTPDWFEIAGEVSEGARVSGGQCEKCGLSEMTIQSTGRWGWVAVCEGMEWDGDQIAGCGERHPVRGKPRGEVVLFSR